MFTFTVPTTKQHEVTILTTNAINEIQKNGDVDGVYNQMNILLMQLNIVTKLIMSTPSSRDAKPKKKLKILILDLVTRYFEKFNLNSQEKIVKFILKTKFRHFEMFLCIEPSFSIM